LLTEIPISMNSGSSEKSWQETPKFAAWGSRGAIVGRRDFSR
jgi:hypothetical protein